jgi:hypothetical protein
MLMMRSPKTSFPVMCAFSRTGRSDQSVVARAVFADLENQGWGTSKHPSSVLFDRSKCVWRVGRAAGVRGCGAVRVVVVLTMVAVPLPPCSAASTRPTKHYTAAGRKATTWRAPSPSTTCWTWSGGRPSAPTRSKPSSSSTTLQVPHLTNAENVVLQRMLTGWNVWVAQGACGGGFTTLLLSRLQEEYSNTLLSTLSVIPAPEMPHALDPCTCDPFLGPSVSGRTHTRTRAHARY